MKIYKKSRIFAIILIECYSPIPTWIGSYIVWVNVCVCGGGGWGGVCVCVGGGVVWGQTAHHPPRLPVLYSYLSCGGV